MPEIRDKITISRLAPRARGVRLMRSIGIAVLCTGTGCSVDGQPPGRVTGMEPMTPAMIAHERAQVESLVAMSSTGTRLCRETTIGIGTRERVEGESHGVDMNARRVAVKITRLGQGPLMIAGREAKLGEVLQDNPLDWTPCR